jgi:hypothetical protein
MVNIQVGSILNGSNRNRKGQIRKWNNVVAVGTPYAIKEGPNAGTLAVKVRNEAWSKTDAYVLNLASFEGTVTAPVAQPAPAPVAKPAPVTALPGLTNAQSKAFLKYQALMVKATA